MIFTASQQRAVESWSGGDTCVVAGPGSGKTRVLVGRLRWLVETKGIDPAHLLAITFTEKAARQMLERLLEEAPPEWRQSYYRTAISTVDAFCTRFLRSHALQAGIDPEFKVIDTWQSNMELRRVISKALDVCYDRSPKSALSFLRSFAGARSVAEEISLSSVHEQIFRLYRSMQVSSAGQNSLESDESPHLKKFQIQRSWIIGVLSEVDRAYRDWKRAAALVDFSDLSKFTVQILGSDRVPRLPFQHILVDEYQDTNPLQATLITLLQKHAENANCALFGVGDINQSIYGFRDASPEVFHKFSGEIQRCGGKVVKLRENFRSRPDILLASEQLLLGAEGLEPQPLVAQRKLSRKKDPSVEVIIMRHDTKLVARQREARQVATRIIEMCRRLRIGNPVKTPTWSDFAVLLRTHNLVREFYRHLREAGIPCQVAGGAGFFENRAVRDLMCLLQVLSNPRDEIRLAAVLCSPLVSISDETLLRLKLLNGNLADVIRSNQTILGEDGKRLRIFAERLGQWRENLDSVPPDLLIWRILTETGYEASTLSQSDGPQKAASVRKLAELSRTLYDTGRFTFTELIEQLCDWQTSFPRQPEAELQGDTEDAVQVMTMHNAKGLEFPIVFLPALDYQSRGGGDTLTYLPKAGMGVKWIDPQSGKELPDRAFQSIREYRKNREREENNRLLYVAITRAEEHLVLSAALGKNVTGWARLLRDKLGVKLDHFDCVPNEKEKNGLRFRLFRTNQNVELAQIAPTVLAHPNIQLLDPLDHHKSFDTSAAVTSIALYAQCPRKYYLSRYLGFEQASALTVTTKDESTALNNQTEASELGQRVHKVLAGSLAPEHAGPEAMQLVKNFQESEFSRRAGTNAVREQGLLFAVEDYLIQGQIDLWFDDGAERVLIDYKTDKVTADEAKGRAQDYALQIQLYAQALEQSSGRRPDRGVIYFLRPNVAIDVELNAEALNKARQTVRNFFAAQSQQSFPLQVEKHCFRCVHYENLCPASVPAA